MTLKELIIGHYEGALTSDQQTTLKEMLSSSPEARSLYEQYGAMEEAMEEESRRLIPPIALREATLVGALGVAAESIGGGIAAWFTTKAAIAVGSIVVAGTAVGLLILDDNDTSNATTPNPPAVEQTTETDVQPQPPTVEEINGTDRADGEGQSAIESTSQRSQASDARSTQPTTANNSRSSAGNDSTTHSREAVRNRVTLGDEEAAEIQSTRTAPKQK